ncbi:cytidine deaminase [Adhaeribacter arboris]|uniref:Cytidine deaminase n=1 Tax=Adhaeribacter arboris TaxID=2072846 RepID=A0A2T2YCY0_9BACT|nr:cytidine deaminase [Adhaeribacter arboris]PSR53353.1 cytidine deaminase [Adhaeribacter arboris]
MARQLQLTFTFDVLESLAELTPAELNLLKHAQHATEKAYAPYSGFLVGTALLLDDNSVHIGNNQENAAYPSGLCAERTALFGLSALLPERKILAMAVTARRKSEELFIGATPCGACRQVMAEYENRQNSPIKILIQVAPSLFYQCHSVGDLLPLQFSRENLLIKG